MKRWVQKGYNAKRITRTSKWHSWPKVFTPSKGAELTVNNALYGHKFPGGEGVEVDWRGGRRMNWRMNRVGWWGMRCRCMSWGVNWCVARVMVVVVTSVGLRGWSRGECGEAMG